MSPTHQRSRPQHAPSSLTIADRLDRVNPLFDALTRDARLGHPLSERTYIELEAQAQGIANMIVAAFRGEPRPQQSNRPIGQIGRVRVW